MGKTKRSKAYRSDRSERTMPTRPRINMTLSHEAFTRITQPQVLR